MRNWLERIGLKLEGWMIGRYGQDELNRFLMYVSLFFIFLAMADPVWAYVALLPMCWSMYRCYSKNVVKRRQERATYLRITAKPRQWGRLQKRKWQDRNTHKYFTCKECGAVFRVPKGKGKIEVTCPNCKVHSIRKT